MGKRGREGEEGSGACCGGLNTASVDHSAWAFAFHFLTSCVHPQGGLTLPTQLAACLLLGASGIVLGTRLMVCDESPLSQDWKRCVIETKESGETVRTLLYDRLRMGSMKQGWEKLGWVFLLAISVHIESVGMALLIADNPQLRWPSPPHPSCSCLPFPTPTRPSHHGSSTQRARRVRETRERRTDVGGPRIWVDHAGGCGERDGRGDG